MRALRSRTVGSTSDSSVNTSLLKLDKKKSKSRKTKLSISKSSIEASDNENVFDETQKSAETTFEGNKSYKNSRKGRHTKQVETCPPEKDLKNTDSETNLSDQEPQKLTKKSRQTKNVSKTTDSESNISEPEKSTKSSKRHTKVSDKTQCSSITDSESNFSESESQKSHKKSSKHTKITVHPPTSDSELPNTDLECNFVEPEPQKSTKKTSRSTKITKCPPKIEDEAKVSDSEPHNTDSECNFVEPEPQKSTKKSSRRTKITQCAPKSEPESHLSDSESNLPQESQMSMKKSRATYVVTKCSQIIEDVSKNAESQSNLSDLSENTAKKSKRKKRSSQKSKSKDFEEVSSQNSSVSAVSSSILADDSIKFTKLVESCTDKSIFDVSNIEMVEGITKMEVSSSSGDEKNKTLTEDQSCIIINDTLDCTSQKNCTFNKVNTTYDKNVTFKKNETFDKTGNGTFNKNTTFDTNNATFEKINMTFEKLDDELIEGRNRRSSRRDTYQINNSSGKWSVEDITADKITLHAEKKMEEPNLDETHERITLHKDKKKLEENNFPSPDEKITLHKSKKTPEKNTFKQKATHIFEKEESILEISNTDRVVLHKKGSLNETFDTPSKSRKKWVKFDSETVIQSPILRKSNIFSDKSELRSSTPFIKKYPLTPKNNKSFSSVVKTPSSNKLKSSLVKKSEKSLSEISANSRSIKKSARKPGTMPNFAKIHQKAIEKIEDIKEYSERKKQRAEKLLSGEKPQTPTITSKINVVKSSEQLFGNSKPKNNVSIKENVLEKSTLKVPKSARKSKTPEKTTFITKKLVSKLPQLKSKGITHSQIPKYSEKSILNQNKMATTQTNSAQKHNKTVPSQINSVSKPNKVLNQNKSTLIQTKMTQNENKNRSIQNKLVLNQIKMVHKTPKDKPVLKEHNKTVEHETKSGPKVVKPLTKKENHNNSNLKITSSSNSLDKSVTKLKTGPVIVKPTEKTFSNKGFNFEIGKTSEPVSSKDEKPKSVFSKGHLQAMANKTKVGEKLANRNNRREQLIGVRTNRRFDLLMQMRNNV